MINKVFKDNVNGMGKEEILDKNKIKEYEILRATAKETLTVKSEIVK